MSKINRFDGNYKAFASEQLTNERTTFGTEVISDDLTAQQTPEYLRGMGIVGPSQFPTLQDFNAVNYSATQSIAYLHQMGVPEWNGEQEYQIGSASNRNGALYFCQTADHVSETPPESDAVNWIKDSKDKVIHVNNIAALEGLDLTDIEAVFVGMYHNILSTSGGGLFVKATGRHDGGTFFDVGRTFPVDWADETQKDAYFADSGVDVVGLKRIKPDGIDSDISWFGAIKDSAVYNSTASCKAAAKHLSSLGGGVLNIPKAEYEIFYQKAESGFDTFYQSSGNVMWFQNLPDLIIVQGNGATFKTKSGLRFGSFDPVTGEIYNPPVGAFYDPDYVSEIGQLIRADNCKLRVKDLNIDGNLPNLIIGGRWGDKGIQLQHYGISTYKMKYYEAINIVSEYHALDGMGIAWKDADENTPQYTHRLINVKSRYNARQGLSWVGGTHLYCEDCVFSHTGKSTLSSAPSAGVDMEAEGAIIRNGTFVNCDIADNAGVGLLGVNDVANIKFYGGRIIGTTGYSTWLPCPDVTFENTLILGASIQVNSGTKYKTCKISMDVADSEYTEIYGNRHDMLPQNPIDGEFVTFDDCEFKADENHHLPITEASSTLFINSNMNSLNTVGLFYTRGIFVGHNAINHLSTYDGAGSTAIGSLSINDVVQVEVDVPRAAYTVNANWGGASARPIRILSHYSPTVWAASVGGALKGDVVFNVNASTNGIAGWICTTAGNPGTWNAWSLTS